MEDSGIISYYKTDIERALRVVARDATSPSALYEPIHYALTRAGKRVRPLLVLLAYSLFKEDWKEVTTIALSVELLHNFTLVHDDMIDQSPLRRGEETVHKKWDTPTAILSGDAMLAKAYEYLARCGHNELPTLLELFNRCVLDLCEGQQWDIQFEKRSVFTITEDDYIRMVMLKTSSLLSLCLRMGGVLAGVPPATSALLGRIGNKMGIIFQLRDDLLDMYGDEKVFGKKRGRDIAGNKKTYVLIKMMQMASLMERKKAANWNEEDSSRNTNKKVADHHCTGGTARH